MRLSKALCWCLGATLVSACVPTVETDPVPTGSAATLAIFAPDAANPCLSVLPYPTDLAKDPETGTLNVPFCGTDTPDETGMKRGLRTLDGYSINTAIYTKFSRAINPATAASAVLMLSPTGAVIPTATLFDPTDGTLYIAPTVALRERSTYVIAISNALKDADGNDILSDQVFTLIKSREPLIDENGYSRFSAFADAEANGLEALRLGYGPLFDALQAGAGLDRSQILVAWTFTTQTVYAAMPELAAYIAEQLDAPEVVHEDAVPAEGQALLSAAGIPYARLCSIHTGRVLLNSLLTDSGTFGVDEDGLPVSRIEAVDYMMVTPKLVGTDTCPAISSYGKIAIFAHGLGRCKSDVLAIANSLASAGWATLALDGPRAGSRSISSRGDQDMDGCADQPATPEFIALGAENPNPFGIRDRLREWALEITQVASLARTEPWLFVGEDAPFTATESAIGVIGHSWGGMASVLAGTVSSDIDVEAVIAASADFGAIFEPLMTAALMEKMEDAGVDVTTTEGQAMLEKQVAATMAAYVWALEPADPIYAAPAFPADLPILVQVVEGDAAMPEAPLHAADTQEALGLALNADLIDSTFSLTCDKTAGTEPICDDPTGVVGAGLMPCTATTPGYELLALQKTAAMQGQLVHFIATLGTQLVEDADPELDCPVAP